LHGVGRLLYPSGNRQQQREREIGRRIRQHIRRGADGDSSRGSGRDIDVVEADRIIADDAHRRQPVE
jgi:hypothetical protein